MGNLRVGLSLSSTDLLSSSLNISVATSLILDSGSLIRAKVKGTAADSDDLAIYIVNQCSDRAYLYIKNLDSQLENYVYIHNDTDTGLVAKIGGGEFAFIPVAVDKKYEVYGTVIDTLIEYGVFGNDNSAAPYGGS
jgi:hypothetical protein|tara:strand:+ start:98 stop:505 length:408 start_codon:yes stop_codon:yes gene_type:complete